MTEERPTPRRERMVEDMRRHGRGAKAQTADIRAIEDVAGCPKRSPDAATPDDLRACRLHRTDVGVTPRTYDARILASRGLFGTTCGREEMKTSMQVRTRPRTLPRVPSVEDVAEILAAAPGPRLKYRAALSISYGAGLRASEVCALKLGDIDSDRMPTKARGARIARSCRRPISWTFCGSTGATRGLEAGSSPANRRSTGLIKTPPSGRQVRQTSGGTRHARHPAHLAA